MLPMEQIQAAEHGLDPTRSSRIKAQSTMAWWNSSLRNTFQCKYDTMVFALNYFATANEGSLFKYKWHLSLFNFRYFPAWASTCTLQASFQSNTENTTEAYSHFFYVFAHTFVTHNPLCQGRANTQYSCHGLFINRSTFSLNLQRIQTPTRASVTNHKLGRKFKLASSSHQKIKKTNSHFVPFLYDLMQTGTEAQKKTSL